MSATNASTAGLPDDLRRATELAIDGLEKAAPGAELEAAKREADRVREALERHASEASARALIKVAHRSPRSFLDEGN